jgi:hypothetical protein
MAHRLTLNEVSLQLDGDKTTFLPGQLIHGHFALTLLKRCQLSQLRLRFSGVIKTNTSQGQTVFLFREAEDFLTESTPLEGTKELTR